MNNIILYIATSQDGFIADKNGGVDWLPQPKDDHDLEVVGYNKLMQRIDTIVMGSNSFKQIVGFGDWGWKDKHTYVFSFEDLEAPLSCITMTSDSPIEFTKKMRDRMLGQDIWLLGGAALAQSFAKDGLIDEIILTIVPQRLGVGLSLGISLDGFVLQSETPLMDGMIQKTYLRK